MPKKTRDDMAFKVETPPPRRGPSRSPSVENVDGDGSDDDLSDADRCSPSVSPAAPSVSGTELKSAKAGSSSGRASVASVPVVVPSVVAGVGVDAGRRPALKRSDTMLLVDGSQPLSEDDADEEHAKDDTASVMSAGTAFSVSAAPGMNAQDRLS